ncbi:MAG: AI-2E family transporter [Bdellovibrionia bacterium]
MDHRKFFFWSVTALSFYVAHPLLLPIVMGAVVAVLFIPFQFRMEKKGVPPVIAASLLTLGITLVLILPISLLTVSAVKSLLIQIQAWTDPARLSSSLSGEDWLSSVVDSALNHPLFRLVQHFFSFDLSNLKDSLLGVAQSVGVRITQVLGGTLSQLPGFLLGLLVTVVSVYFFLVDGRLLTKKIRKNSVLSAAETERVMKTVATSCRSVILASVVSGLLQALVEGVTCLITGVPNAAFISFGVFLASFVPVVGTLPVTLGVAFEQLLQGHQTVGIILFVMAGVISILDNFIRPLFLKGSAQIHPLVAFVAAFGGLQAFGFSGVFLGPVIAALFGVTLDIFLQRENISS